MHKETVELWLSGLILINYPYSINTLLESLKIIICNFIRVTRHYLSSHVNHWALKYTKIPSINLHSYTLPLTTSLHFGRCALTHRYIFQSNGNRQARIIILLSVYNFYIYLRVMSFFIPIGFTNNLLNILAFPSRVSRYSSSSATLYFSIL